MRDAPGARSITRRASRMPHHRTKESLMSVMEPRKHLAGFAQRAHHLLVNDLKAIAEDRHNACPGGCAKSALRVVVECAAVNGLVATYLSTGQAARLLPEQREAHYAAF